MPCDIKIVIRTGSNTAQEALAEISTMNAIDVINLVFNTCRPFRPYFRLIPTSPETPELFEARGLSRYNFSRYCHKLMHNDEKQQLQVTLRVASDFELRNLLTGVHPSSKTNEKSFNVSASKSATSSALRLRLWDHETLCKCACVGTAVAPTATSKFAKNSRIASTLPLAASSPTADRR